MKLHWCRCLVSRWGTCSSRYLHLIQDLAFIDCALTATAWLDTHNTHLIQHDLLPDEHMENLSLHDAGSAPPGQGGPPAPVVPQLPVRNTTVSMKKVMLTNHSLRCSRRPPNFLTLPTVSAPMGERVCAEEQWCTSENTEKLMVVLRDGRKLIGVLRSWDQFGRQKIKRTIRKLF